MIEAVIIMGGLGLLVGAGLAPAAGRAGDGLLRPGDVREGSDLVQEGLRAGSGLPDPAAHRRDRDPVGQFQPGDIRSGRCAA